MGTETRNMQRDAVEQLRQDLALRFEDVEGGAWDGIAVLTRKAMDETFALFEPTPPSAHVAAVVTPATLFVDAACPLCGHVVLAAVQLHARLTAEGSARQVQVKGKSAPVGHVCGQTVLAVGPDEVGTEPFDIDDLTGTTEADDDDSGDADASLDAVSEPDDEPCPWPDCVKPAGHSGQHRKR
jgi:hypothetical protein